MTRKLDKENAKIARVHEATTSTFNFISHQGPPRVIDTIPKERKTEGVPPRGYNFVTNLSDRDHLNAPTLYDEAYVIKRAGKPKEKRDIVGNGREFSIINNNFTEDHDRKKMKEYERFKSHTLEKYWATHDYDPVRGKFYDAEKEQRYREQRQMLSDIRGTAQMLKLAPSAQYSEGNCYDIVNHSIHDDGKVTVSNTVADRSLHRMKRVQKEIAAREEGNVKQEKDEVKKLNRVSYKRWENTIDRGYDFLKNSVTPADAPHPLPPRPVSMWAKLQTADNVTIALSDVSGSNLGSGRSSTAHAYSSNQRDGSIESPYLPQRLVPLGTTRAATSVPASRAPVPVSVPAPVQTSALGNQSFRPNNSIGELSTARSTARGDASRPRPVPSLDLTRAEPPEKVSYVEPAFGAKGLSVPMVRTGGLSAF